MDHYSHFIWVYPLQKKSDTFGKFLHFSAYVRTQFNRTIKALQCDNGGEYISRIFLDHLAATGTEPRFPCPHTSQQNGRAERMVRTINKLVRTFLVQAHMPYSFRVEALHTAVHTLTFYIFILSIITFPIPVYSPNQSLTPTFVFSVPYTILTHFLPLLTS